VSRLWLLAYVSSVSDGRCSHLSHSPPLSLFPNAPLPQPSHLRFSRVICSLTVPTTTASSSYSTWSLLLVTFPHIGRAITVGNGGFSGQCVPLTRLTKWDVPTNRECIAVSRLSAMSISHAHELIPCPFLPNALTISCLCDTSPRPVIPQSRKCNQTPGVAPDASTVTPGYAGSALGSSCPSQPALTT